MMIRRSLTKISGPLVDVIDIHIDVPAVNYRELWNTVAPDEPKPSSCGSERSPNRV